jgi:hypothetical protein
MSTTILRHQYQPVASITPTYLVNEGFEGAGTPSGWTTAGGSGCNFDYTTTILEGTQSLAIEGTVDSAAQSPVFTAQTQICLFCMFRFTALPASQINCFGWNSVGATKTFIGVTTTGAISLNYLGGGSATSVGTMSANTLYYCKYYYRPSASASLIYFSFSTDGFMPFRGNNFVSLAGTTTGNPDQVSFENFEPSQTWIWDHVRVASQDLGDLVNWP